MNRNKKIFFIWLFLVVLWNFGIYWAEPIYDVLVAVILSFFAKHLDKKPK